jgi:hypothetical protein
MNDTGMVVGAMRLRYLIVLLAIVTITIVALTVQKYYSTRRNISVAVIQEITEKAESRIQAFFSPIASHVSIIKDWIRSGDLKTSQPANLSARFIPILEQLPQIYSIKIASDDTLAYVIVRDGDTYRSRNTTPTVGASRKGLWQRLNAAGKILEKSVDSQKISPREKNWFQGAIADQDDEIFWTDPYELYPAFLPGVTAAAAWKQAGQNRVAALSVRMQDIRQLINSVRIGDRFRIFLYSDKDVVIDFQRIDRRYLTATTGAKPDSHAKTDMNSPVLIALQNWKKSANPQAPFSFQHDHSRWWGLMQGLEEGAKGDGIGILVAEDDLISRQKSERYLYIPVALAVFWVAFLFFVRNYYRKSKELAKQGDILRIPEEDLSRLIEEGESDRLEFKSTLRWNIKTDKAGKEIELAALKTIAAFMNSDGGALMVGVADNGKILGIDADRLENDDKFLRHFSGLFNQHIGLEFIDYIDFAIKSLKDKQIFVVTCRKSPQPVFLRHKKDENFYVRSGPSSRQLTTSQVIEYLKDR